MIYPLHLAIISAALTILSTGSVSASSSPGCGKDLPSKISPGESQNFGIEVQGLKRHYRVHIPQRYDKDVAAPLILSYHGRSKNMTEQEALSQFSNEEFNTEAIAVYPQGHEVSCRRSDAYRGCS
jgi:poly(3-hydroxybutyrate) depolymerase